MFYTMTAEEGEEEQCQLRTARSSAASPEELIELSASKFMDVRLAVVEHPNCTFEALQLLATDPDGWVRQEVAAMVKVPYESATVLPAVPVHPALTEHQNPRYPHVPQVLVLHHDIIQSGSDGPAELLALLAHDEYAEVRRAVAANVTTPQEVFDALALDDARWIPDRLQAHLTSCGVPTDLLSLVPELVDMTVAEFATLSDSINAPLPEQKKAPDLAEAQTQLAF